MKDTDLIREAAGLKKKESIKGELLEYFKEVWQSGDSGEARGFFGKFFQMFVQAYEYEKYKESLNRSKYYFYKFLVLLVVLSIPLLVLFLLSKKEWVTKNSEWNDMYLYAAVLVPLIFAYLANKYIKLKQYYETWYRHLRTRHQMEWRMLEFVKDHEMLEAGLIAEGPENSSKALKIAFINDMCEYWKTETDGIPSGAAAKEENIFEDISKLLSGKN